VSSSITQLFSMLPGKSCFSWMRYCLNYAKFTASCLCVCASLGAGAMSCHSTLRTSEAWVTSTPWRSSEREGSHVPESGWPSKVRWALRYERASAATREVLSGECQYSSASKPRPVTETKVLRISLKYVVVLHSNSRNH